ncbi:MAG: DUF1176 domain-containing protein [Acidobacteriaceae bacterium]|nr:DUF1176 domain-containing protein [Acidobacteriaceae bacterium]
MKRIRSLPALATGISFAMVALFLLACRPEHTSRTNEASGWPNPDADRAAWRKALGWSDECEQEFQAGPSGQRGVQFYDLGGSRTLAEVACSFGAYQGSEQYYLISGNERSHRVQALQMPTYEATGADGKTLVRKDETEITGLPEFNRSTKTLSILNRYRGPGDCGSYATYAFERDRAVLKEFRAKLDCDGTGAEHPEKWPLR